MEEHNMSHISSYYTYMHNKNSSLPDGVCEDLNLDDFYSAIDFTSSRIGQQYLYSILHHDRLSGVEKYEGLICKLAQDKGMRTRLMVALGKLNNVDAYYIASLFAETIPMPSKKELQLLKVCRFLPFLSVGLLLTTHAVSWLFLLLFMLLSNLFLHYRSKRKMYQYYSSIPQLLCMLKQARILSKEPLFASVHGEIVPILDELNLLRKRLRFVQLGIHLDNEMAMLFYTFSELFNIFFLAEAYIVSKSLILLDNKKSQINEVFCFCGMLDVLCSIALLRGQLPYYCLPAEPANEESLRVNALYHPLIKDAVSNDIVLYGKSVLVTGSNMSGKTSFIRAIGLNLLSAKVLGTCFARSFTISTNLKLLSAIHTTDNLVEGKSYFLQEVEQVKEMIDAASKGSSLFLLDEPFKGTNTKERVAIGKAVLSSLGKDGNIVFVSTHDLELGKLLEDEYDLYYFSESVKNDELLFDYKLKKGVATERSAIKILEIYDYPKTVIQDAYSIMSD